MPSVTLPVAPTLFSSPQCLAAGEEATNLYLRGLFWCAVHGVAEVPSVALATLTQRPDAADLAMRLVAAGMWTQTADGWQAVDDHRRHVSAVRAAAGRRSGQVRNEQKEQRSAKFVKTSVEVPDTTYARASGNSGQQKNSVGTKTTESTAPAAPPTRATPTAEAAVGVPPKTPTYRNGEAVLARLSKASGGRFDHHACSSSLRAEFIDRFAAYNPTGLLLDRMGLLLQTYETMWGFATRLDGGNVNVAVLLGKPDAHGERSAAMLADLIGRASKSLADDAAKAARAEAQRQREERARTDAEAYRAQQAARRVVTPEEFAAIRARSPLGKRVAEMRAQG